jgi:hypothetical protein
VSTNDDSHRFNVDIRQSSGYSDASVTLYREIDCDANCNNIDRHTFNVKANECAQYINRDDPSFTNGFSNAIAKSTIPKGVTFKLKLDDLLQSCSDAGFVASGLPGACASNTKDDEFNYGLGYVLWKCEELPVLTKFLPADITGYIAPECVLAGAGSGLVERKYPTIEPNVCIQPDKMLINRLNSARAIVVPDTGIPKPDGYKCELVLFEGSDCRKTSEYSYGRRPSGQCLTPAGQMIYPLKGMMWQCGFA